MPFYDSVKEDIRGEHGETEEETGEGEEDTVPFDQLKEDAKDREEVEEAEPSSDADIEVLGDGEPADTGPDPSPDDTSADTAQPDSPEPAAADASPAAEQEPVTGDAPTGNEHVELLRRIEEQNQEMLDVLRGIKRSLE